MRDEGKTKMSRTAASRIQAAACKSNNGITPQHSFASRAMSAAYRNEPQATFFSPSAREDTDQSICPCPSPCTLL